MIENLDEIKSFDNLPIDVSEPEIIPDATSLAPSVVQVDKVVTVKITTTFNSDQAFHWTLSPHVDVKYFALDSSFNSLSELLSTISVSDDSVVVICSCAQQVAALTTLANTFGFRVLFVHDQDGRLIDPNFEPKHSSADVVLGFYVEEVDHDK